MKQITSILILLLLVISCQNSAPDAEDLAPVHDHGALAILIFQEDMELFAETDQLFEGHEVEIRAHLTFLKDYSPAQEGILYARIVQDQKAPDWEPLELAQPGIYTGTSSPESPGICCFEFMYAEGELEVVFSQDSLKVFSHDEEPPEVEEHHDEIIFTKEQAWKTEFGLMPIKTSNFTKAIHCSGEIAIAPSNRVEVIAPASGKIIYSGINLVEGSYVKKGSVLFTLLGTGLGHDNILMELNTAQAEYEKSSANLKRKEKLLKIEAVSQKDYEEAKAVFETDKTRYHILQSQVNNSGLVVKCPASGYITEVLSVSNSYAETGSVLLRIIKEGGLLIKANVPSKQADKIKMITSANFKLPYDQIVHSSDDWDGKVISSGRSTDPETGMIPLFFSVNKTDLIAGTFVELWLLADAINNQVVVPETSLLEEYGLYYVFVQEEGEAFEKRLIQLSGYDGMNYLVTSGLSPGEVIVSKGAMAIKLANAMGEAPVHSH